MLSSLPSDSPQPAPVAAPADVWQILHDASERGAAMLIRFRVGDTLNEIQSRFITEGLETERRLLITRIPGDIDPEARGVLQQAIDSRQPVMVYFNLRQERWMFESVLHGVRQRPREEGSTLAARAYMPRLVMDLPSEIRPQPSRKSVRVTVPRDMKISVRLCHSRVGEEHPKQRQIAQLRVRKAQASRQQADGINELSGDVRDICAGGVSFIAPPPPAFTDDAPHPMMSTRCDDLVVVLEFKQWRLEIPSQVNYIGRLPNGNLRVGVKFHPLAPTFEGRRVEQALLHIVAELERAQVRRLRFLDGQTVK